MESFRLYKKSISKSKRSRHMPLCYAQILMDKVPNVPDKSPPLNTLPNACHPVDRSKLPPHSPPLKQTSHFDEYYKMTTQPMPVPELPIASFRDQIVDTINSCQVTIITGSPGCGKTTQVPQYIMDYYASNCWHCNMIVLQPRRVSAVTIAERVCMEKGWPVGSLCGYKIGLTHKMSDDTRLLYVTTGIFLQILLHNKNVNMFTHIFFDEIHERERDMDFSLMVVKKYLTTNSPDTKLIMMSATAESDRFADFFSTNVDGIDIPAPVIEVDTPPLHEVEHFYLDDLKPLGKLPIFNANEPKVTKEFLEFSIALIAQFDLLDYKLERKAAVLVFLPGLYDIEQMFSLIKKQMESGCGKESYKWKIFVLHGTMPPEDQQKTFCPAPRGYRKIILSTNVAESSITIPDVSIVIDFCLTKILTANCKTNTTKLIPFLASKANLTQRYGRVGRVGKGLVYRMITKAALETEFGNYNPPDMRRCLLEKLVLQTIYLGMGDPVQFLSEALDPPTRNDVKKTLLILKETGAIPLRADSSYMPDSLTLLGRLMAVMPLDIRYTRLITLGYMFSVFKESIIIAACMTNKSVLVNPIFGKVKAYETKLIWANGSQSDCISLLNVYQTWKRHQATEYFKRTRKNSEADWAFKYRVNLKALYEVDKLIVELTNRFKKYGIKELEGTQKVIWTDVEREFVIKVVVAGAFYPNYFWQIWDRSDSVEKSAIRQLAGQDPFRTVLFNWYPYQPNVSFCEDIVKHYMSECDEKYEVLSDSRCVYLKFSKDEEPKINPDVPFDPRIPGGISLGVYKAVKLGHGINEFELKSLNRVKIERNRNQRTSKEGGELVQTEADCVPRKELIPCWNPSSGAKSFPVKITHIVNPNQFWCVALNDKVTVYQNIVNKQLDSVKDKLQMFSNQPEVGQLCVVKGNEGTLYRGKLSRIFTHYEKGDTLWEAMVYLLDTGETKLFKSNNIMKYSICLWNNTKKIPCLAFECTLTKVRASPYLSPTGKWIPEAIDEFKKITNDGHLFIGVYSFVMEVVSAFLRKWVPKQRKSLCVNEYMVDKDYAVYCTETWWSENKYDHNEENKNTKENIKDLCEKSDIENFDNSSETTVKGPASPLTTFLYCCTVSKMNDSVIISGHSVNSVLLNPYSRDHFNRLLVAGTVSHGRFTSDLTLGETTLMPHIPGWASIIPLIFTPTAEVRTNRNETGYAGAICGLGVDKQGNAIHPDNDIHLFFDTVITEEDLAEINRLRFSASAMLIPQFYDQNMCSLTDRLHFKRTIQECFRNLFLTKRDIKEVETPICRLRWGGEPSVNHWEQQFIEEFDRMLLYRAHQPKKLSATNSTKVTAERYDPVDGSGEN